MGWVLTIFNNNQITSKIIFSGIQRQVKKTVPRKLVSEKLVFLENLTKNTIVLAILIIFSCLINGILRRMRVRAGLLPKLL